MKEFNKNVVDLHFRNQSQHDYATQYLISNFSYKLFSVYCVDSYFIIGHKATVILFYLFLIRLQKSFRRAVYVCGNLERFVLSLLPRRVCFS